MVITYNIMRELLDTNIHPYQFKAKWHSETPRPGSSYTITPWESDFQKAVDRQIKVKIAATKTLRRPIIRPIQSPRRSPRIQSHVSIDNPMATTKIKQIEFHQHSPDQQPRTQRSIDYRVRMPSVLRSKDLVKLPNIKKLKPLPTKLGLRGKRMLDKIRVQQLIHAYSPRAIQQSPKVQNKSETLPHEIVPINLQQEFSKKKIVSSWLGGRKQDVMNKLYNQIRSTIRLP